MRERSDVSRFITWLILAAAIGFEVSGSLALRGAVDSSVWFVWVVIAYSTSIFLLDRGLRRGLPLGVAYGIWAAAGVALTAIMAAIIFGEPLSALMGFGIVLIMAGVVMVEFGSHPKTSEH